MLLDEDDGVYGEPVREDGEEGVERGLEVVRADDGEDDVYIYIYM